MFLCICYMCPRRLLLCREHASGISEIIKYGLIRDAELFAWLEENMQALLDKDPKANPSASLPFFGS